MICGQSRGSDLEGSVDFYVCVICSLLLESLKDPILRVPLSSLSARADRDSLSDLTRRFLVDLDREIYFPGGLILLCTMLNCGRHINVGTKGTSGVMMIS